MKFRSNISFKIGLGFGILIIIIIINSLLANRFFKNIHQLNNNITQLYIPTINGLRDLKETVHHIDDLCVQQSVNPMQNPDPILEKIRSLQTNEYTLQSADLNQLSVRWSNRDQERYAEIKSLIIDSLFTDSFLFLSSSAGFSDPDTTYLQYTGYSSILPERIIDEIELLTGKYERLYSSALLELEKDFTFSRSYLILTGIVLSIITIIISVILIRSLVKPLNQFKKIILDIGTGKLPGENIPEGNDEMGQMATALNNLIGGLKALLNFAQDIGKGKYDTDFQPLSENDSLGNSLIRLKEDLKNAALEEAKRKDEDQKRNWANQGIAKFSDILRQQTDNINDLSSSIISNLVKYLDAKVGGLFLINQNKQEKYIELMASYAYDRKKYLQKRILFGEGIAGRCVEEGETIYMTDIPDDYIKIKSGLGEDKPRSLLLVPLKLQEEIYGIIELASLHEFEPYHIEFVEQIGTRIASSISIVKSSIQTSHLLKQSQQQTEEMASQEEELRQNMEEMRTIQEQSAKREEELKKRIEELELKLKQNKSGTN